MGLYDRDYYREEPEIRRSPRQSFSAVTTIIILNVLFWVVNGIFFESPQGGTLTEMMKLRVSSLTHPLEWYRFITYGFAHDPSSANHILFNMLSLFFLGPYVENRYGKREFWFFYLTCIVLGGIVWALVNRFTPHEVLINGQWISIPLEYITCIGASAAVAGVVLLFTLNYPHVKLLLMFVIPMPAWILGFLMVFMDVMGAAGHGAHDIGYAAHLAGAGYALLYFMSRFSFTRLMRKMTGPFTKNIAGNINLNTHTTHNQDNLHIYHTDRDANSESTPATHQTWEDIRHEHEFELMDARVNEILKKMSLEGINSLTEEENAVLRQASEMYRNRNRR